MKEIRFDDRVAIVTGTGGGLGLCYARQLAQRGASVVVNDLGVGAKGERGSAEVAQRAAEDIRERGGNAIADWSDVADPEGAERLIELTRSTLGRVDIVISNAGILRDSSFPKMSVHAFTEVVNVHLLGAVNVLKSAWPLMVKGHYGRVVLVTSHAGLHGNFGQANYSAAKLALVGLMNSLRIEGARSNILINAIAPLAATKISEQSTLRLITDDLDPAGPAAAVLFLSSDAVRESRLRPVAIGIPGEGGEYRPVCVKDLMAARAHCWQGRESQTRPAGDHAGSGLLRTPAARNPPSTARTWPVT